MGKRLICTLCLLFGMSFSMFSQSSTERREDYLKDILQINIDQKFRENTRRTTWQDSTWANWLIRSGELPPDFSTMPHIPFLPEPLVYMENGKEKVIQTRKEWDDTRIEEAQNFYNRTPSWSKMGKYITYVSAQIDGLESLDYIDKKNIYLLGNTLGGLILTNKTINYENDFLHHLLLLSVI